MATLSFVQSAFNNESGDLSEFEGLNVGFPTSTSAITHDYVTDSEYIFRGTQFGYTNHATHLARGTISEIVYFIHDSPQYHISDLILNVSDVNRALKTGDYAMLMGVIFAGDDKLNGSSFDDHLNGYAGNDTIIGEGGGDNLTGGRGGDTFVFSSLSDSTSAHPDEIMDLEKSDSIDLSAIDANSSLDGDQSFHLVRQFHGQAGELTHVYDSASGETIIQGDVDGDGVGDFTILLVGDHARFHGFVL